MDRSKIRNFSIVAHIDHGKSTLADRILEQTKAVPLREMENQLLDNMDLERERGITIKAHAVTLVYTAQDGEDYIFNLIDTPGHVDFNYEVSRSLAACEGAVLVVDASQGIEAQTLANTYLAVDAGLEILPVVNKIDLPSADPERVCHEIEDVIGIPAMDAPRISAKTGENIQEVMERIVTDIPAPGGNENDPLRALIFDSYYDAYRGVIVYVRIKDGQVRPGDTIRMMATGGEFNVVECGFLRATTLEPAEALYAGEVGYIAASIKDVRQARVGDTVTLVYTAQDGEDYVFNLIDTPGHVDFNYEVSRSLAACEGAVLVVDASQGIEAQTLANTYLAVDAGLEIVPVVNKIDLPSADPDRVCKEIEDVIGIPAMDAPRISAKTGENIGEVMERIVSDIPAPQGDENDPLRALIFDSYYDSYRGVIVYVRIKDGTVKPGDTIRMMATGGEFTVVECGFLRATNLEPAEALYAGEVGYIAASIKDVRQARVGDTVTLKDRPAKEPLEGYRAVQPMVFCGIYPADGAHYTDLRDALEKLQLNDASLTFEPETSVALGFGFRCGFLGLLHMEIIQERLEREYDLDLITTAPSVVYKLKLTDGSELSIDNPTNYPDPTLIASAEEPICNAHIYSPSEYVGNIMELCQERRGVFKDMKYLDTDRVDIHYELPLNEIVYDFFDALKSRTRGYASFDYELMGYQPSKLVKLDIMLNGEIVDALSFIIHADKAYPRARKMAEKLKEKIPRQLFEVPIQACVGGKIIARETVKALRKDVLAKCYGGDITRKKKLLEKQKEGKKRMRQLGSVEVPQEAFMSVLKLDE